MKLLPIPFLLASFVGSLSAATFTVSQDGRGLLEKIAAMRWVDEPGMPDPSIPPAPT